LRPPGPRGRPPPRPGARCRDSRRRHRRRLTLDELNLAGLSLELAKINKSIIASHNFVSFCPFRPLVAFTTNLFTPVIIATV
jgi:hypothetical protein